jgi:hypothetical protein
MNCTHETPTSNEPYPQKDQVHFQAPGHNSHLLEVAGAIRIDPQP